MLKNIFVYLLHNSIAVCVVILTVFAVRLFLRRAPKKYSYILWSIVGIYLLCPIRLSSPISIYSLINNVSDTFLEHHSLPLNAKNFADKNKTYNEKNQKTIDTFSCRLHSLIFNLRIRHNKTVISWRLRRKRAASCSSVSGRQFRRRKILEMVRF